VGTQPRGYDQYAALYNQYTVNKAKLKGTLHSFYGCYWAANLRSYLQAGYFGTRYARSVR